MARRKSSRGRVFYYPSSLPKMQDGGRISNREGKREGVETKRVLNRGIDLEGLKEGISQAESVGGVLLMNPESTATGLYGQRFSEIKDTDLYSGTREEFSKDFEAQNAVFDKRFYEGLASTETTPLERDAYDLYKEYKPQIENFNYSLEDLAALSNFLGRQGTRTYLGKVVRDGNTLEEAFPTKFGKGAEQANKTPEEYLKITRPFYKKEDNLSERPNSSTKPDSSIKPNPNVRTPEEVMSMLVGRDYTRTPKESNYNPYGRVVKEVMDENKALYNVGAPKKFNIIPADERMAQHLKKTGRGLEYLDAEDTWIPFKDRPTAKLGIPGEGANRVVINTKNISNKDLKEAVALDFISHSMDEDKTYKKYKDKINTELVNKYGQEFIDRNGGIDAYVRGILASRDNEEYQPYREETDFLNKALVNDFKKYIKTGEKPSTGLFNFKYGGGLTENGTEDTEKVTVYVANDNTTWNPKFTDIINNPFDYSQAEVLNAVQRLSALYPPGPDEGYQKIITTPGVSPSEAGIRYVEKDPATGLPKLKKGGNIQKQGYKYNSPYRNRRYIDIHSNKITMDDVPERLWVRTDTGEERILEPNSGEYYFPGANVVREMPLRDTPLYFSPPFEGLTKYQKGGGILSEPVSGDVPTTLMPEINITGFKDNSYSFTGLPTIAPESSKTGKKCSTTNCAEQATTEFANIVGTSREEISPLVSADAWYRKSKVLSNPNNELIFEAKTADYDGYKNLPVKPEGDWWEDIDFQVGDFVDLSGKVYGTWRSSKQPKLGTASKDGYNQSDFARHSGIIVGKTPEGIPIVRHNIAGTLYDEPITDISERYNYFPSAVYRVNDENFNEGKQQYSIKQQENYENITNYSDESLDLPFTGAVTDDKGNTLKVDTKKVNKKLVEPYKEIRKDLVVNYGVPQERLDDIFKTLLAIGTQESNLDNMVDDSFKSKAKVSVLDAFTDPSIKAVKYASNVKGQIENLLSDYEVAEIPTWKLDKEIALLEAQGVPKDEAVHQTFSQYGAPSKTDKVTDPSRGPFRQKAPSGRWLETMGKEYSTVEAMRKANWGKEWNDSNKNFIANAIGLYLDNYDKAKQVYGENESEEFLNQVATLAHNAPTKAFTKEYTDFYIKGIDNPDPAKYNAGYVNKVYNAKNSMFRQPRSSRENNEGNYRGFIDKSAESSNQQQNSRTPLVDVPSYFSGSKIGLTEYQTGGQLPKAQEGRRISKGETRRTAPTYITPEMTVQAFPNATPAQRAALSTGPGNPIYRNAKSQLMNNKRPGNFANETSDALGYLVAGAPMEGLQTPQSLLVEGIEAARGNDYNFKNALPQYVSGDTNKQRLPSQTFLQNAPFPLQLAGDILIDPFAVAGAAKGGINAARYVKNFPKAFTLNLDDVGRQAFKPSLNTKQLSGFSNTGSNIKAPKIINNSGINLSELGIGEKEITDIAKKIEGRLLTDKFITNNMKATGRTRKEVIESIENFTKELNEGSITFEDVGNQYGGLYLGNGKIVINTNNLSNKSKGEVLGTLDHELNHLFSDSKGAYVLADKKVQNQPLYDKYPTLKLTEEADLPISPPGGIVYQSIPMEQQVRFRKAIAWLEENAGLKQGETITEEMVEKLGKGIKEGEIRFAEKNLNGKWTAPPEEGGVFEYKFKKGDYIGGVEGGEKLQRGYYSDIPDLLNFLDPSVYNTPGSVSLNKTIPTGSKLWNKTVKDVLNKAYMTIPVVGAGVVGSQYFSNPQEQVEYRNGGALPKAEVMTDPATGLPKLKKGGKAWIQSTIKKRKKIK